MPCAKVLVLSTSWFCNSCRFIESTLFCSVSVITLEVSSTEMILSKVFSSGCG